MKKNIYFLELGNLAMLLVIFLIFSIWQWGFHYSEIFIDYGRELYIPTQMLVGKALYGDIFNIYPPLSYQVNSLLYSIFGLNNQTLLVASTVNSILILLLVYGISRLFFSRKSAFSFNLLLIVGFLFYQNYYQVPYSFGIVYGNTAIYASVLSVLIYLRRFEKPYMFMAWLLAGMSLSFKYEFLFFLPVLFWITVVSKKFRIVDYGVAFMAYILIPAVSLFLLFLTGTGLSDIYETLKFVSVFIKTPSLIQFYRNFSTSLPDLSTLMWILFTAGLNVLLALEILIMHKSFGYFSLNGKNGIKLLIRIFLMSLSFVFYCITVICLVFYSNLIWTWVPLGLTLLILVYRQHLKILFLILSAFSICLKGIFYIPLTPYGIYLLPLAVLGISIFVYRKNPKIYPELIFSIISILFLSNWLSMDLRSQKFLRTPSGNIRVSSQYLSMYQEIIEYFKNSIGKEEAVLIIPEGQIINFITGNPSHNKLFSMFMTPYMAAFGEDQLIMNLEREKIPNIVLTKRSMYEYFPLDGTRHKILGEAYGQKTGLWIKSHYDEMEKVGPEEYLTIYKLKK